MKLFFKQKILRTIGAPEFIVREQPEICMLGFEQVSVENYRTILQYSPEKIVLKLVQGKLQIEGQALCVKDIGDGTICIVGTVEHIWFPKEG